GAPTTSAGRWCTSRAARASSSPAPCCRSTAAARSRAAACSADGGSREDRMGRLDGRAAIITGAGFGIGRGIARRFAREGASVTVAEIDRRAGERVTEELGELGGQGLFVQTDVTDRTQIDAAVAAT